MGSVLYNISLCIEYLKSPATRRGDFASPGCTESLKKKTKTEWRVVCFAKLLSVFIQYLKCGIDVTFCSGRLRLFF